jgi:hypothetical protein
MIRVSRLAMIAAVAAALATPAFAQSFDPEAGTGNVLPFSFAPTAVANGKVAVRQGGHGRMAAHRSGLHAFAMVPGGTGTVLGGNSNDPALTGGGSIGYNQMLLQD